MRFYAKAHKHYCGIDLHARSMYVCVLGREGAVLLHRNLPCEPERFLSAIHPYREDVVVGVECIFTWYWLADLCAKEGIAFVLGHALYMRSIHGSKTKNDRIDSRKLAGLLRGGLMPQAYVYPAEMRGTRDLMRRRLHFVRHRGQLLAHIQMTHHQYNFDSPRKRISYRSNRDGIGEGFADASVRESIAADLALVDHYEVVIGQLEVSALRRAIAARDRLLGRLPPAARLKRHSVRNKTGVIGVCLVQYRTRKGRALERHSVSWTTAAGERGGTSFSVARYGHKKAFRLAVETREQALRARLGRYAKLWLAGRGGGDRLGQQDRNNRCHKRADGGRTTPAARGTPPRLKGATFATRCSDASRG